MRIAIHDYAGHPFQFELSRALAAKGHTVRHMFYADDPGPKGDSASRTDDVAGFSVAPMTLKFRYRKEKFVRRLVGDHLYGRAVAAEIRRFKPDVVLSGNTPLDAQRALWRAAQQCGARFVFWVQDFYGIAIERLVSGRWGGLGTAVARYYRSLEIRLLRASAAIVLISPDFEQHLPPGLAGSPAVHVIRNWGALKSIAPQAKDNVWARQHGLVGKFVLMYTGTLALKHDPNLLLGLCDAFSDDVDVQIVVVAAGVNADKLKIENARAPRRNLTLLPLQPAADLPLVLGAADVLVALLERDAAEFSVPSKLLSYLCAGRPVLLSAPPNNLATRVLAESGAGASVAAGDGVAFAETARTWRHDGAHRTSLGQAGAAYAAAHFDIDAIAVQFERAFGLADPPGRSIAMHKPPQLILNEAQT